MKHILILGGYTPAHKKIKKIANTEITLFNYTRAIKTYYKDLYNKIITFDKLNEEEWIKSGIFLNSIKKIDNIITFDDDLQNIAIVLSEKIGINYGYNKKSIDLLNDKYSMRQYLLDKKFSNIKSYVLKDKKDLINSFSYMNTENIIIKPINGSGSKYILKVNIKDNMDNVFDNIKKHFDEYDFIIEPFIEGIEFSVESYSEKGKHTIYCITKKYKDEYFVETGHTIPAKLEQITIDNIKKYIQNFLDLVGIKNGPVHTEIIINGENILIVESQARVGGDMINELYQFASDIDILSLIVQGMLNYSVIDKIPEINSQFPNKYATILYKPSQEGTVSSINIKDEINKNKNILGYRLWCSENDVLIKNNSSIGRIAQVWVLEDSYNKSFELAQQALQYLEINIV